MPRTRNELLWRPGYSLTRKPVKKATRGNRHSVSVSQDGTREFEFIREIPTNTGALSYPDPDNTRKQVDAQSRPGRALTSSSIAPTSMVPTRLARGKRKHDPSLYHLFESQLGFQPSTVLYNDLLHQYEPILIRYNEEFCKIPLTTDLRANPFQYNRIGTREPVFLVHAAMALAGHHLDSPSTQHHRYASLQLLRESLNRGNLNQVQHMLDAIILLFSLDETQSALGTWSTHLTGAYGLLETYDSIKQWQKSQRLVAQVGLVTWWDAILNLVNREDCVFPMSYFEAILEVHDENEWDYFGLCGCPLPIVKIVMRLARLGAEKRRSISVEYSEFDDSVVVDIEKSLESWHYLSPITVDDEESMQEDQDRMHCSEAWRNGLLLYIYRVFHWKPGEKIPVQVLSRARVIADHVFASRDDNMITRQALLPLFLAGCELRDPSTRRKIIRYCTTWDDKTRYHMFYTTVPLLQQVWAEQEEKGCENAWWGQVVDDQHATEPESLLQRRLCFG